MKKVSNFIIWSIVTVLILGFLWFAYQGAKSFTYHVFYRDMVIETIKENVKKESLRE